MANDNRLSQKTFGQAVDQAVLRSFKQAASLHMEANRYPLFPADITHLRVKAEGVEGSKHMDITVEFVLDGHPWTFEWMWSNRDWLQSWPLVASTNPV